MKTGLFRSGTAKPQSKAQSSWHKDLCTWTQVSWNTLVRFCSQREQTWHLAALPGSHFFGLWKQTMQGSTRGHWFLWRWQFTPSHICGRGHGLGCRRTWLMSRGWRHTLHSVVGGYELQKQHEIWNASLLCTSVMLRHHPITLSLYEWKS